MDRQKVISWIFRCAQLIVAGILTVMMIKAMKMMYIFLNGEILR